MNKYVDTIVSDAMDHFLPFIIQLGADEVQNRMDSEVFDFFGVNFEANEAFGKGLAEMAINPDAAKEFADVGFTEYLQAKRLRDALKKMVDTVVWMSGSNDFGPEGQAHEGWVKVQPALAEALSLIKSEVEEE